ncbi:CIR protein PIR protein [Plasmodium vinckei]|uniref:CIR protein PIR protein n=1 Tax=Plasmodium vinckei TaxID=5860 RepID=A0A6V7T4T6_PLAVN|nr:CIR protein PIR protein [Plasmodium vinckei]
MAQSSYNIEKVYKEISTINGYFSERNEGGLIVQRTKGPIDTYCHYGNKSGKCNGYFQMASSGVIHLLKKLKGMSGLECDKLAEYAILWLCYKLNIKPNNNFTDLNKFYNQYIVNNNSYNEKINGSNGLTYKEIIDKKKNLINTNEISKFYVPFHILFSFYNLINANNKNWTYYSHYPKLFANKFEELNNDSKNIEVISYNKMLSTLSDDYNNLKNKYGKNIPLDFPSIPKIVPIKDSAQNLVEIPVDNSGKSSGQTFVQTPEVTSSDSSISTTLIPALSTFSVIPVFLGIAYKYSLFGIDKLFQRQYLRKKLKKVKKKMKLNI